MDYLTSLAARALGVVEIAPRLASRFESDRGEDISEESGELETGRAPEIAPPASALRPKPVLVDAGPAPAPPRAREVAEDPAASRFGHVGKPAPPAPASEGASIGAADPAFPLPREVETVDVVPLDRPSRDAPATTAASGQGPDRAFATPRGRAPSQEPRRAPRPLDEGEPSAPMPGIGDRSGTAGARQPVPDDADHHDVSAGRAVRPRSRVHVAEPLSLEGERVDRESVPSPNEPVVQVTIGRVEVRATTAHPVPTAPRKQPLIMTLEDYVRLRKGEAG